MEIKGKKIEKIFNWKVYYDVEDKMACGEFDPRTKVTKVYIAKENEELPTIVNKPQWQVERKAVLIIFK